MSLIPNKREVEEIAGLLEQGAASPEDLAKQVIKRVSELREQRQFYTLVFELSPGVYSGYGPFATRDAAFDSVDKNPMAYIATKAAIVPIIGHKHAKAAMEAKANEPPASRTDPEVAKDVIAFKRGWRGKVTDRERFLQQST